MARYRLHHSLGRRRNIRILHRWAEKHFSDQKKCRHQNITDAMPIALLARLIYKQADPSVWWSDLKADRPVCRSTPDF